MEENKNIKIGIHTEMNTIKGTTSTPLGKQSEKYFIPSIEDIRVGYELQYHNWSMDEAEDPRLNYNRWETTILKEGNVKHHMEYGIRGGVRVPYLTKEQIEAEGYKHIGGKLLSGASQEYCKEGLAGVRIRYSERDRELVIDNGEEYEQNNTFYYGECKDINTFRYICKLLNIK